MNAVLVRALVAIAVTATLSVLAFAIFVSRGDNGPDLLVPDAEHFPDQDAINALRNFDAFPVYWVGEEWEGNRLSGINQTGDREVALLYGQCRIHGEGGCAAPLQISTEVGCFGQVGGGTPTNATIRGAAVGTGPHLVLQAGDVTVTIFGGGTRPSARLTGDQVVDLSDRDVQLSDLLVPMNAQRFEALKTIVTGSPLPASNCRHDFVGPPR